MAAPERPEWVINDVDELEWVDLTDAEEFKTLLGTVGSPLAHREAPTEAPDPSSEFMVVPIVSGWLRLGLDRDFRLTGRFVDDPMNPTSGGEEFLLEERADDLVGWCRVRTDLNGDASRWLTLVRRPEREAYAAVVYHQTDAGPTRSLVLSGIYPDVMLCAGGERVLFVEPDADRRSAVRAVLASSSADEHDEARVQVAYSYNGGIHLKPCSNRRFVKLGRGPISSRLWQLFDLDAVPPTPILLPGVVSEPGLVDVGQQDGQPVLLQAINRDDRWQVEVSPICMDGLGITSVCATGTGQVKELHASDGAVLIRTAHTGTETVQWAGTGGFSSPTETLASGHGRFDLTSNSHLGAIGFLATQLVAGTPPIWWYWDAEAKPLNSSDVAARTARIPRKALVRCVSADGFVSTIDLRWDPDYGSDSFQGPVVLMVYGAYGIDIDLDTDPTLRTWLQQGFCVGTPFIRGGGSTERHLAGVRAHRPNTLADVKACIQSLRRTDSTVHATQLVVLGASAGGFLAGTTLNTCATDVDAAILVNGYLDPLPSLLSGQSPTIVSDWDEWGNPTTSEVDYLTLREVSPYGNLRSASESEVLVIVSGRDVRVNPRQGAKFAMKYRNLGGSADLWYDLNGTHDCWGIGADEASLLSWVEDALSARSPLMDGRRDSAPAPRFPAP